MTYASLFNDEAVELAKQDHEKYGDEIALSLLGLPCEEFREKYKTKDFCIWMFSMEDKKAIVNDVVHTLRRRPMGTMDSIKAEHTCASSK